ncbi:DegT/DnrJ/EryC1/StrS family aminotransferase [Acidihalobacter ferrooxydans]|uniref:Erythromycin biosynthesis sensory transduction protein eryC1 n=1 Tax=Acidihalobacter ferrooxydans TaxID=1765967 RepID=A0A1P8UHC7_9GAMM|nr:DegT/DnrJ/EryC1/StrS family aminotransferase [Acidihalobacter ferrooxydans]APZ43227.1 erythromycin biosynthesis sensory transduction protein eryC1 [Acidihalobacter ferrooxydans]
MIPMLDLKTQYRALREEINQAVLNTLESTQFILGPNVQAFEQEAAAYLGVEHAIGVASGTDALHLALIAAGVKAGDEVITSPFTFIATAEAILYVGATPVFVDIDADTFNLDPARVEAAITPRTRAILPVHLFGQPADMSALTELAAHHDLIVLEDCAQSFGATFSGGQTGSLSMAGCFSFFPSKNLGCYGDGGLISTNSTAVAEHLRVLRNHGSWKRYHHSELGFNSRLDEIQAAILRIKLRHIDEYNAGRRRVARRYTDALMAIEQITPPLESVPGEHIYHQYTVLSPRREDVMSALQAAEIACAIYYPIPLHQQDVFAQTSRDQRLPVTESVASQCFSLPVYPELPDSDIDRIVDTIRSCLA